MGELPDEAAGLGFEPHEFKRLADEAADFTLLLAADPRPQTIAVRDLGRDAQVLEHRELGEDLGHLKGARHAELHAPMGGKRRDVDPVEGDPSRARRKKAADQVEEGRLAGAVRSDDGAQLSLRHAKRDAVHGHEIAEALGDIIDFQDVHAALLRAMTPNRPRGKNNTTATNSMPTKDIQLTVRLDR
jgi:hypothetical protein